MAATQDKTQTFNSLGDLFAFLNANPRSCFTNEPVRFYGAASTADAVAYVKQGASEHEQAQTRALMDKVDTELSDRERREYVASPVGAFACVPEYLQGMPANMRRRVHVESEAAPVRIVVETLVSGGVNTATLARRGAAIAALVTRLSETRPVELWAAWSMLPRGISRRRPGTVVGKVKLDTSPISLGHLCAVMNSAQFYRAVTFPLALAANGAAWDEYGGMAWGWSADPTQTGRNVRMREALGLDAADVFIPGGYLSESDIMMRDPVAWVNKYLDEQRKLDEAHAH